MRNTKDYRRHHNARLKAKRTLEERTRFRYETDSDKAIYQRNIGMRLHTPCLCSCAMCCNPRRINGNSRAALTMQELRAPSVDESEL